MEAATNIAPPQAEPLRPDEKQWLTDMYNKLVSKMWRGFLGNAVILVLVSISPFGYRVYAIVNDVILSANDTWLVDQRPSIGWWYKSVIAVIISAVCCALYYLNIVLPYKQDAEAGVKLRIPYVVTKKEYFNLTGQCFVWLNNAEKHCEVDTDTYNKCDEGATVYVEQVPRSKYIFSDNEDYMSLSF